MRRNEEKHKEKQGEMRRNDKILGDFPEKKSHTEEKSGCKGATAAELRQLQQEGNSSLTCGFNV